jgi:chromosomal replication initiation ATPase DnaA
MFAAYGKNTMANAKFKPREDDGVVRKIVYRQPDRQVPTRQMIEDAWKRQQEAERLRKEVMARAVSQYRVINIRGEKRTAKQIIVEVAERFGFTHAEIVGKRRNRALVEARFACVRAVADERPDLSIVQIGKVFDRDHSTLCYCLKKTRKAGAER